MRAADIRETFLSFFEAREHRRMPSASLVPSVGDASVLLTTAGMQPFKPYFRGEDAPPAPRLTSCQKCFRTTDIENVGLTARHLTFFEMLGNFSFGDYFKEGAVAFAYELSTAGFGFDPEQIWITVFGGDDALGIGPDDEAIARWRAVGISDERIVRLGREDNFWQAGPTGPSGPCSELYLDRGLDFGGEGDRPGDDSERFLEFWNCVFMQYELHEDGSLTDLPATNIDTGLGLDRMAAILQDVPSVFETDQFRPLVDLGEALSGTTYGAEPEATRALRVLADHGRGMAFLMADGVVPSNEDRGYVLRRIMRRAIERGRSIGIVEPFLHQLCERTIETMGGAYPQLVVERASIERWARAEEEGFSHTLEQGERLIAEVVERARLAGASQVPAAEVFRLHDTYGFPREMTVELLAGEGLGVDGAEVDALMARARATSRTAGAGAGAATDGAGPAREQIGEFVRAAGFQTRFRGYEETEVETIVGAIELLDGVQLVKLSESPFYAEGGGQVSDGGVVEGASGVQTVVDVVRFGEDQAVVLTPREGRLEAGETVTARVARADRIATVANHTATHLLHAALRDRLGTHVRQAGSYVGPDKLRFDFTHGARLSPDEVRDVEGQVNAWIAENVAVHAVVTSLEEARSMGAMALFGEKYGDVVRVVEVEGVSRELCGGTHVATTAEIGLFHLSSESSSASNVRRIEAVTGQAGAALFGDRDRVVKELGAMLRVSERDLLDAVRKLADRVEELERTPRSSASESVAKLAGSVQESHGMPVVVEAVESLDARTLLELSNDVRQKVGDGAVVLGTTGDGRVHLVANFADAAVARGLKAGDVVRVAAEVVGGSGGGRDGMAQAGGRDPEKLPEALVAARGMIERVLSA